MKRTFMAALLVAVAATPVLGDAASRKRGVALLNGIKTVDRSWFGKTALQIYRNKERIGTLTIETAAAKKPKQYRVTMRSEVQFGPQTKLTKTLVSHMSATSLVPIDGDGGVHRALSNGQSTDKYVFGPPGKKTYPYTFTRDAGGETEERSKKSLRKQSGMVVLDALYCGFPALMLKMKRGVRYTFAAIDPDTGQVKELSFLRGRNVTRTLFGKRTETAVFSRIAKGTGQTDRLSFSLDAKTGAVLEIKIAESPISLRPGKPTNKADTSPTRVVLDFFTAVSKRDSKAFLGTIEPKTFIWNDTNKDPKAPSKKQFDRAWAKSARSLTDEFVKKVFDTAHENDAFPKGEDMSMLQTGAKEQILGTTATVKLQGKFSRTDFSLRKTKGRWKITKMRYHSSSGDSRGRKEK